MMNKKKTEKMHKIERYLLTVHLFSAYKHSDYHLSTTYVYLNFLQTKPVIYTANLHIAHGISRYCLLSVIPHVNSIVHII